MIDYKKLGLTYKQWVGVWTEAIKVFLAAYVTYVASILQSGDPWNWFVFSVVIATALVSLASKWLEYLRTDSGTKVELSPGEYKAVMVARQAGHIDSEKERRVKEIEERDGLTEGATLTKKQNHLNNLHPTRNPEPTADMIKPKAPPPPPAPRNRSSGDFK